MSKIVKYKCDACSNELPDPYKHNSFTIPTIGVSKREDPAPKFQYFEDLDFCDPYCLSKWLEKIDLTETEEEELVPLFIPDSPETVEPVIGDAIFVEDEDIPF